MFHPIKKKIRMSVEKKYYYHFSSSQIPHTFDSKLVERAKSSENVNMKGKYLSDTEFQ